MIWGEMAGRVEEAEGRQMKGVGDGMVVLGCWWVEFVEVYWRRVVLSELRVCMNRHALKVDLILYSLVLICATNAVLPCYSISVE